MHTISEAKQKVLQYIDFLNAIYTETYPDLDIKVILLNELTQKHDFGWVFFYQSNGKDLLGGNGPLIIETVTLDMYQTMTAISLEDNISISSWTKYTLTRQ